MEENRKYRVQVGEEIREYVEGTTFEEIAKDFQEKYENQIVLGSEAHKLFELRKELLGDCGIQFITTRDDVGNKTYKRSMCLMLVKAIHDICGHDAKCKYLFIFL